VIRALGIAAMVCMAGFVKLQSCYGQDSLAFHEYRLMTGLSGSVTGAYQWMGTAFQNIAFNGFGDFLYTSSNGKRFVSHVAHWELGFTKFRDSIWMKHADLLRFQLLWSKESPNARQAISVAGRTQLFDSYYYSYDVVGDRTVRQWAGSFFNPADVEAGYGYLFRIPNYGTLNLAIATVRLRHIPATERPAAGNVAITRRGLVILDYGCSAQAVFLRSFGKSFDWYLNGRFFLNGAGPDNFNTDLLNRFTVKLWRIFQFRLESRVVYEPLFFRKMQYRNELLAGIFYDFRK
jgi:hypothetical protein